MKKYSKRILTVLMVLFLSLTIYPVESSAITVTTKNVKIGLFAINSDGSIAAKNFSSANLQNVSGYGYGYELGYFDDDRNFVSVGCSITETDQITMIMDKNMYYVSSSRSYEAGTEGDIVVGCYHIQIDAPYPDYAEARAAADTFTSVNAFVKYSFGSYYVCAGDFTSAEEAANVAATLGIQSAYSINSGTSYTVTVVKTGTDKILFEFEYGTTYNLGIRPIAAEEGAQTRTWFKGYYYTGDFTYQRISGGNLYVINVLPIEDYVKGVIPYEMSPSWPVEALKAQAVCARTFVISHLNAHKSSGFDVCNTECCQVYRGMKSANDVTNTAVNETAGMYLTYNGELCATYYYSCNGGASENSENVWTEALGYCKGVIDPYEAAVADRLSYYNWTVTYTGEELAQKLRAKGYDCSTIVKFGVTQFTPTGNVYKITLTDSNGKNISFSKEKARTFFGFSSQRYTINGQSKDGGDIYVNSASNILGGKITDMFAIGRSGTSQIGVSGNAYAISGTGTISEIGKSEATVPENGVFVIEGSGRGHNVGMSQWGAYAMAYYYNLTYTDILTFYYSGAVVELAASPEEPAVSEGTIVETPAVS